MKRHMSTESNLDFLLELLASRDALIREKSRKSLVAMGQTAVEPLVKALNKSKHIQIRWEAVKALGEIGDVGAIPQLVKALEDDELDVAWLAAEELRSFKKSAWPPLLKALVKDDKNRDLLRSGIRHIFLKQKEKGFDVLLAKLIKALEPGAARESAAVVATDILEKMDVKA